MQLIELRESMFDNVVNNIKIATLRKGKRDYDLGEVVILGTERNRVLLCNIDRINIIKLSDIGDEDAQQEGYQKAQELIDVMNDIYGKLEPDQVVTQVWWTFIKEM
jgi:hypothetical protein